MLATTIVYYMRMAPYRKCEREIEREVNGIRYVICYTNVINAWYNNKTKKIYVSSRLAELLADDEITAIIYHEEGHARNRRISYFSSFLYMLWMVILAVIIIVAAAVFWNISLSQSLTGIFGLYTLAAFITLVVMTISWIGEHESDKRGLEKQGLSPIARGLIKVHVYGELESANLLHTIKGCELKNLNEVLENYRGLSMKQLFSTIIKQSLKFPKHIVDFLYRPIYPTHPPLWIRLTFLVHYSKQYTSEKSNGSL